jgi:hypothetical protein
MNIEGGNMKPYHGSFMLSLMAVALLLTSCATAPTKEQMANASYGSYPTNYQASITNYMSNLLFDPYSAVYRFGSPYKGYAYVNGTLKPPMFGYLVDVGINAKNRMSGYVGALASVAANQQGSGKGSSYHPKGGRYYLTINAVGSWTVKVIEVK